MLSEEEKRRRLALLQQQNRPTAQPKSPFDIFRRTPTPPPLPRPPQAAAITQTPTTTRPLSPIQQIQQQARPTLPPVPKPDRTAANWVTVERPNIPKQVIETVLPNLARLGRGYGEVLGEITGVTPSARAAQERSLQQGTEIIRNLSARLQDPTLNDVQRQNIRNTIGKIAQIDIQTAQQMGQTAQDIAERTDPLKAAAAIGMTGLDILGAGTLTRGGRAALGLTRLGQPARTAAGIAAGAAGGAAYGGLGAVEQRGAQVTPQELGISAGIGGALGGAIPATFGIFGRLIRPVQRILGRETAETATQAAQRAAVETEQQAAERVAREQAAQAAPTPRAEAPAPARSVEFVPDEQITRIVAQKDPAEIEAAIRNIFPDITQADLTDAITRISRVNNEQEARQVFDSIAELKDITTRVTPEETMPTTAAGVTEQKLAQEAELPAGAGPVQVGGAIAAPEAPGATQRAAAVPEGIQGAQAPTTVPKAIKPEDMAQAFGKSIEAEQKRYKGQTLWRKIKNFWDPRSLAYEVDRKLKAIYEARGETFTPDKSLYQAIGMVSNFEKQAQQFARDTNLFELYRKYGTDKEFNIYRIYKRNIESVDNGGKQFLIPLTDQPGRLATLDEQRAFMNWYETKNPQAINDLRAMSRDINLLQDQATAGNTKILNAEDLTDIRIHPNGKPIEFYTPIQRVMPDELLTATISGQNVGSVARQSLLRDMQYGAQQAIDYSLWAVHDYVRNAKLLENRVRVGRLFVDAVQQGLVKNAEIEFTGEQVGQLATQKALLKQVRGEIKQLGSRFKVTKRQERRLMSEINKLQREGMKEAIKTAGKPGFKLTPTGRMPSTKKIFESLIKLDSANLTRIRNKIATREPKLAAKLDEVITAKSNLENAKLTKQQIKQNIVELTPDPTTGRQMISHMDEQGRVFKIEVPPEWASTIQGIDKTQLSKGFKAARTVSDIFKAPIIALNPSFQAIQTLMTVAIAPLYSKEGFRLWNPKYLKTFVQSFSDTNDIVAKANRMGAPSFNGNLNNVAGNTFVDQVAAQYNTLSKSQWYNPLSKKGIPRIYNRIMEQTGKLDRAVRTVAFESAYKRALSKNLPEEQAMAAGLEAWTTAAPDFSNVSTAVKVLDLPVTFLAPTQVSIRDLGRAFREDPASFLGKASVITAPMFLITAYNLSNNDPKIKEFYKDMKDSDREYVTSNNIIYTIPGVPVEKDKNTGEWKGIFKIPLAPELRPLQQGFVEGIKSIADGNGLPPEIVAKAIFNTITGKVWDVSNPMYNLAQATINGKDPRTGAEVWTQDMNNDQKREAILRYWSRNAGPLGQAVGTFLPELPSEKGKDTPNAFEVFIQSFTNRFKGAYGASEAGIHYQSVNDAIKKVGLNQNELTDYNSAFMSKSTDALGNDIKNKKNSDSIKKAIVQLDPNDPSGLSKLWRVNVEANKRKVERGVPSNPMYELNDKQAQVLLTIQTLADNKERAKVLADQNPWLKDYYQKQNDYWDKVMSTMTDEQRQKAGIDSMGIERPVASKDLQTKLDQLNNLKTSTEKSQFYSDNPDVLDFFSKQEEYQRFKDAKRGLPLYDKYPTPAPEVKAMMDEYNTLPKQNGPLKKDGTPSSPDRSAWIRNNPQKWAIITDQWNKQDIYRLQQEGALAVYEGIDFTEKGIKSLKDIAEYLGMSEQQFGNTWANYTPAERQYLTDYLQQLQVPELKKITGIKAKDVKQYKLKLPSTARKSRRIRLQ